MATVKITGVPVLSLEFENVPSVNWFYNRHFRTRGPITAEWRFEAKDKARQELWWGEARPVDRALVVVKVYPFAEEIADLHNVHIKPLLDGLSDAMIWKDDEWAFVPVIIFMWGGASTHVPREKKIRRTVIEVYELEHFVFNQKHLTLPKGRTRVEK